MAKKLGLCLGGGGAKGAYQIGAVQALETLGLLSEIKAFSGTSIGAANISVIASRSLQDAKGIWDAMPERIPKNEKEKKRLLDLNQGIYSMQIFEETMDKAIDYETLKQKEVYITVSICGETGKGFIDVFKAQFQHYIKKESQVYYLNVQTLSNTQIRNAITASCSIPVLFSPVTIEDKKCYDGGLFDNTPIKPLIESGCDEIIVVNLHKRVLPKLKDDHKDVVIHEIKHEKSLGSVLAFNKENFNKLYKLGYQDTMDYFKRNRG